MRSISLQTLQQRISAVILTGWIVFSATACRSRTEASRAPAASPTAGASQPRATISETPGLISNWLNVRSGDEVDLLTGLNVGDVYKCRVIPSEFGTPQTGDFEITIRERDIPGYGKEPYALIRFFGQGGIQAFGEPIRDNFTRPLGALKEAPAEGYSALLELKNNQPYVALLRDGQHYLKILPLGISGRNGASGVSWTQEALMVYTQPFPGRRLDPSQDDFGIDTSALFRWKIPPGLQPYFSPARYGSFRLLTPAVGAIFARDEQIVLAGVATPNSKVEIMAEDWRLHWAVETNAAGLWMAGLGLFTNTFGCELPTSSAITLYNDGCPDRTKILPIFERDQDGSAHPHVIRVKSGQDQAEARFTVQSPAVRASSSVVDFGFFLADVPYDYRINPGAERGQGSRPRLRVNLSKLTAPTGEPVEPLDVYLTPGDAVDALLEVREGAEAYALRTLTGYRRRSQSYVPYPTVRTEMDVALAGAGLMITMRFIDPDRTLSGVPLEILNSLRPVFAERLQK